MAGGRCSRRWGYSVAKGTNGGGEKREEARECTVTLIGGQGDDQRWRLDMVVLRLAMGKKVEMVGLGCFQGRGKEEKGRGRGGVEVAVPL